VQYNAYTDRTLLGQAIFCILNPQGLTRTSQVLPFGLTEINSDKPAYIPDYCRRLGSRQINLGLGPKDGISQFLISWLLPALRLTTTT